jgi:glycosyltransferase involved in cell wall biosynthesis
MLCQTDLHTSEVKIMVETYEDSDYKQDLPTISIIIPSRNEERFIEKCLVSLLDGTYPCDKLEVFVVDGCSTDNTTQVVKALSDSREWNVRVINNPDKTQSHALNMGIQLATGKYIARADAHSEYQPDYLEKLAGYMEQFPDISNVGGMCDIQPSKKTMTASAIATAYSHKFATGNALWRVGVLQPTIVDTVPFGFFRREVFKKYGVFDVDLTRNQDQEFNHRIIAGGDKILLVPDVVTVYYSRPGFISMARMFFQYGWFKPLSQSKQKGIHAYRQFMPIVSFLFLIALILLAIITKSLFFVWFGVAALAFYLVISGIASINAIKNKKRSYVLAPLVCMVFWVIHTSFLLGNIKGIIDFLLLKKRVQDIPLTR